tara:strand:+ start:189 stop:590 length:402 start_codon:yes stop_codon:yes gene_type:complete
MARRRKAPKLNFAFTAVPKPITRSTAWFARRPVARLIWIAVLERFNVENNGKISFSVREAGAYAGCTPNTTGRMFNELITVGLLECTMKTSFTNGKRLASIWALTHLPISGKLATNQWKSFKTEPSNTSNTAW